MFIRCLLPYCIAAVTIIEGIAVTDLYAESLADMMERCEKSVVRINTSGEEGSAIGSGYLIDDSGIFATNCHVLAGATSANAVFSDNSSYPILGTYVIDAKRDIVIAKINCSGIKALRLSNTLPRKGESVTAIGAPLGLDFTVTNGIVSAIRNADQMKESGGQVEGTWIQIDASLSPGNSGGPLINSQGEVVAMSTLASIGFQNLNFGISSIDILATIEKAKSMPLTPLSKGIAKIQPKSQLGEDIAVPPTAIAAYVEESRKNFDRLLSALKQDISREQETLREMNRGGTNLGYFDPQTDASVARFTERLSGEVRYMFRNEVAKTTAIDLQKRQLREMLDTYTLCRGGMTTKSLCEMLCKAGGDLDTRRSSTVGFVKAATCGVVVSEKIALIDYQERPYIANLHSTAGLYPGDRLLPSVFFVAGTQTLEVENRIPLTLTVLQQVDEQHIRKIAGSDITAPEPSMSSPLDGPATESSVFEPPASQDFGRLWTSRDGKFQVSAILLSSDGTSVKLRRTDNSQTISVPIKMLSESDQRYIAK